MTGPEHRATDAAEAVGRMPVLRGAPSGYGWRIVAALGPVAIAAAQPDARDERTGGIFVSIDFNGDEADTVALRKAGLDRRIWDAYESLYTVGCEDLAIVQLNARMRIYAPDSRRALPTEHGTVFQTKLKREIVDTVDWANKEGLDFNQIWETIILNVRWKRERDGD
jgi:hypothetical protein